MSNLQQWNLITPENLPPLDTPVWLHDGKRIWVGARAMEKYDTWLWADCCGDVHFAGGQWHADTLDTDDDYNPTHWMSLPLPPEH